jgi:hypothetical protein
LVNGPARGSHRPVARRLEQRPDRRSDPPSYSTG